MTGARIARRIPSPPGIIPVLVTGTHRAALSTGVFGAMGPGNKCRDDTEVVSR
jgi:hypothetical protein